MLPKIRKAIGASRKAIGASFLSNLFFLLFGKNSSCAIDYVGLPGFNHNRKSNLPLHQTPPRWWRSKAPRHQSYKKIISYHMKNYIDIAYILSMKKLINTKHEEINT